MQVVGKTEPVSIFEPMFRPHAQTRAATLTTFAAGLQFYYARRFDQAAPLFETIAPQDPPSQAYLHRCRLLIASPPDPTWDGVWVMDGK